MTANVRNENRAERKDGLYPGSEAEDSGSFFQKERKENCGADDLRLVKGIGRPVWE